MRWTITLCAVLCFAAYSYADSGTITPGSKVAFGNVHVANLAGAGGNVNYTDDGHLLTLVVHADAACAVLKRGPEPQARRLHAVVLGDGYLAQANMRGARIVVLGDHAVALSLAVRPRHVNAGNTIDLWGDGNLAAAVRWCHGQGRVAGNRIRFGGAAPFAGNGNDAYLSGGLQGTRDVRALNRSIDVNGTGNRTMVFDGFDCATDERDDVAVAVTDVARDASSLRE